MRSQHESRELLARYVSLKRLRQHAYASEVVLRALAERLGEDQELWGAAGLLHDLDVEMTRGNDATHTREAVVILRECGYPEALIDAVRLHNENAWTEKRSTAFQYAVASGENIAGLIVAAAYFKAGSHISCLSAATVMEVLSDLTFMPKVNRKAILECEKYGVSLDELIRISFKAMQKIANEIGL
jgi:putative nucleotidyltransferase with HDIG domain